MSASVSNQLVEKYNIQIRPGGKGQCPFCKRTTFSVKRDDTVGKCFHPNCGQYVNVGLHERRCENTLHLVLASIFTDFHLYLLEQQSFADYGSAYAYMTQERRIHPWLLLIPC
jgi:hypothetical protein